MPRQLLHQRQADWRGRRTAAVGGPGPVARTTGRSMLNLLRWVSARTIRKPSIRAGLPVSVHGLNTGLIQGRTDGPPDALLPPRGGST